jgi:hypothetical protein
VAERRGIELAGRIRDHRRRIVCLEEVAFRQGFIDAVQLEWLAEPLKQ